MLTFLLLFSSCSTQRNCDAYFFSERLNALHGSEIINPDGILYDGGCFNYLFSSNGRSVLLSLTENEKGDVICSELTVMKSAEQLSNADTDNLFSLICECSAVLENITLSEINELFSENEFGKDKLSFTDNAISFSSDGAEYFLRESEELIYFYVKRLR